MQTLGQDYRSDFVIWLRSGRWPKQLPRAVERKFNPYHDPRNGQFTFAPSGSGALRRIPGSIRNVRMTAQSELIPIQSDASIIPHISDAVFRPDRTTTSVQPIAGVEAEAETRVGTSSASRDAKTMEEVFPGLSTAPGGLIFAASDDFLGLTSAAQAMTTRMSLERANSLINEIKEIDPHYRFDSLGFPATLQGQMNQINDLRFDRAVNLMRLRGDLRPMQVETLRFMQASTDRAYERGLELLDTGKLRVRLSKAEALGNFIDREVRRDLRAQFNRYGIEWWGPGPMRINRNEYNRSGSDLTFRRPDSRVDKVAYDVTLAAKTRRSAQVRGFFAADFRPNLVVIIRPSQLGSGSTYAITRPEIKK